MTLFIIVLCLLEKLYIFIMYEINIIIYYHTEFK